MPLAQYVKQELGLDYAFANQVRFKNLYIKVSIAMGVNFMFIRSTVEGISRWSDTYGRNLWTDC